MNGTVVAERHWMRRKAKALLKLLALAPQHQLHREQLMEALWPELEPELAANNLNKALHAARRALEPDLKSGAQSRFLQTYEQHVQLHGALWIDVEAFEQQAAAALKGADSGACETALALYAGDLLEEDRYEDWAVARREQLRRLAQRLLEHLAQLYESGGQTAQSIEQWQRLLGFNAANEEAQRRLMELYARSGSRHQAIEQYQRCREAVRRELDAEPEPATTALYEQIVAGQFTGAALASGPRASGDFSAAALAPALAPVLLAEAPVAAETVAAPVKARRRLYAVVGAIVLCVAAFGAWRYWLRPASTQIEALAVLPFTNSGGDEYVSDGITESLINNLSRLPGLRVLARTTAFRFKGREFDPQTLGQQLQVQAILTGRVQQRGDELQIQADLIDAKNGAQLWGDSYKGRPAELLALQTLITRDITGKLRQRLTDEERTRSETRATHSNEAWQAYLKGRYHWNRRTIPETKRAVEEFDRAIQLDPQFALAYVGLADAWHTLSGLERPPSEAIPRARAAVEKALALDDQLAAAHASLGIVQWRYDWNYAEAERSFKRAIALDGNYASAHQWYGLLLAYRQRNAEALVELKQAQQLDPLSLIINANLGLLPYFARRYDEAIDQLKRTLELDQNFAFAHFFLGWAYEQKGDRAQALVEFRRAAQIDETPATLTYLGHGLATAGNRAEALAVANKLQTLGQQRYVSAYYLAILAVGLGEKERAFDLLAKAVEEHADALVLLAVEPKFDPLRNEPRFQALLQRLGLN
ncbi:MAG: winged helix-turn-helix domain-containing protein [Acidobacteria bacterium]|nr:winged helix-turn-helix domain-containing protein [Acidobacteriota bacterium]